MASGHELWGGSGASPESEFGAWGEREAKDEVMNNRGKRGTLDKGDDTRE